MELRIRPQELIKNNHTLYESLKNDKFIKDKISVNKLKSLFNLNYHTFSILDYPQGTTC